MGFNRRKRAEVKFLRATRLRAKMRAQSVRGCVGVGGGAAPQTAAAGAILLPFRGGLSFMAIMRSGSSCP